MLITEFKELQLRLYYWSWIIGLDDDAVRRVSDHGVIWV